LDRHQIDFNATCFKGLVLHCTCWGTVHTDNSSFARLSDNLHNIHLLV